MPLMSPRAGNTKDDQSYIDCVKEIWHKKGAPQLLCMAGCISFGIGSYGIVSLLIQLRVIHEQHLFLIKCFLSSYRCQLSHPTAMQDCIMDTTGLSALKLNPVIFQLNVAWALLMPKGLLLMQV